MNSRAPLLALVSISACLGFVPSILAAQTGGISGVVVARTSGEPLAYSIVGLDTLDRTAFASDSGRFGIRQISVGLHVLHVRRLGFTPLDLKFTVRDGVTDTVRIELDRVAVSLGPIVVKSWPPCANPGAPPSTELSQIVEQIRLNAEQYKFLSTEYPFSYDFTIKRSERLRKNGMVVATPMMAGRVLSKSARRGYKPGEVIYRRGRDYVFQVPTLSEVADRQFIARHCWHYGGVQTVDDEEMYRIDIVADDSLKDADVNGSFFVNKATFQIRRSILHLSKRPSQFKDMLDMETTTDFFEVLPSISIPSHIYSVQTIDPEKKSAFSESYEEQLTLHFKFLGRRPGDAQSGKTP